MLGNGDCRLLSRRDYDNGKSMRCNNRALIPIHGGCTILARLNEELSTGATSRQHLKNELIRFWTLQQKTVLSQKWLYGKSFSPDIIKRCLNWIKTEIKYVLIIASLLEFITAKRRAVGYICICKTAKFCGMALNSQIYCLSSGGGSCSASPVKCQVKCVRFFNPTTALWITDI